MSGIWRDPAVEYPAVEAGDRIVLVVTERVDNSADLRPSLVLLEATETGWYSPDALYGGYSPAEGVAWAYERDVCRGAIGGAGD